LSTPLNHRCVIIGDGRAEVRLKAERNSLGFSSDPIAATSLVLFTSERKVQKPTYSSSSYDVTGDFMMSSTRRLRHELGKTTPNKRDDL